MKPEILEINTALQMQKPVNVVFEAIVDPQKMSNYFISRNDELQFILNHVLLNDFFHITLLIYTCSND
jgi:hypothetical protein